MGLSALAGAAGHRAWRRLAVLAGGLGTLLVLTPLLPHLLPAPAAAFARGFFPPGVPADARAALLARVLRDAATGGAVAVAVGLAALLVLRSVLTAPRAAGMVAALVAADLLRTGAGLNPMVTAAFFRPSPPLEARLPALRRGRVFTCSLEESPAYLAARAARGTEHEAWSFSLLLETLTPAFNVPLRVPTALSPDLTMLVPGDRVFSPAEASCRDLDQVVPRLREAAVDTVVAVSPLVHDDLEADFVLAPARAAPLAVHVHRLVAPRPRVEVSGDARVLEASYGANDVSFLVEAGRPEELLLRDGWAPGWTARVDGEPALVRASGRHRVVLVPPGRHRVAMQYRPPGLRTALGASGLALAAAAALAGRSRRRGERRAASLR
jgi:hypothetical protein